MLLKNNPKVLEALLNLSPNIDLSNLTITGFLGNLLSVTTGNIIGGTVVVGLAYWFIIVRPERRKRKEKV